MINASISQRELEVLNLIAFEFTAKEIADQLYISINTVKTHKRHLQEKLHVRNVAGLVRRGFELGFLASEEDRFYRPRYAS